MLVVSKVYIPDTDTGRLQSQASALLAGTQGGLRQLSFGDVVDDAVQQDAASSVVYSARLYFDISKLA